MRILTTSFMAFDGSQVNPSEKVVRALELAPPDGVDLYALVLPVDTNQAPHVLLSALESLRPQAVVLFGEAGGRTCISIERIAVNLLDFRIPDNAGVQIVDLPILPDGPAAYFSTLPVRLILQSLVGQAIPAELSLTAGSYLCNQVFYLAMHWAAVHHLDLQAGFIHLPSLPEQVAMKNLKGPSMAFETIENACRLIISVINQP